MLRMKLLIKNIGQLVTVAADGARCKSGKEMGDLHILKNAAIKIDNGVITEIDPTNSLEAGEDVDILDAQGKVALPGFVDSHTHTVFAGSREDEFALRAAGKTYQEIAEAGGGILSTVRATRAATKKDLLRKADRRLTMMMSYGTTTAEIKTGYGLSVDDEMKMLDVINDLRRDSLMTILPTFLAAHAFPPEYQDNHEGYVDLIINRMLPFVAQKQWAVFCDAFCDTGYFDLRQTELILLEAKRLGLIPKVHTDQLSAIGATELGCRLNSVSVDHLENISTEGIRALRRSSTIATVLPGVSFFLNHPYAPARTLIDEGIPVAIATDFNPGSSMSYSMQMMLTIACTQMHMRPEEAITAATLNGAAALGISHDVGSIEVGKLADIILFDVPNYTYIPYHYGVNHAAKVIKNGVLLEF
jgi:imidazolonepropionase